MGQDAESGDRVREELRLLLEAIAARAQEHVHRDMDASGGEPNASASCGWCPVCVLVGVARGERSETTVRLAEWLHEVVTGLHEVLAEPTSPAPSAEPPPAEEPSRVSRIAVSRVRGSVIDEEPVSG